MSKRPNTDPCICCKRPCGGNTVRHRVQLVLPGRRAMVAYCWECRDLVAAAFDRAFDGLEKRSPSLPVPAKIGAGPRVGQAQNTDRQPGLFGEVF